MNSFLRTVARPWCGPLTRWKYESACRVVTPLIYMAIIFFFSSIPGDRVPKVADDRIEHSIGYFVFGLVLLFGILGMVKRLELWHIVLAWFAGVLYAASDEWHQSFVPGREVSMKDLTFDTLGLTVALLLLTALIRRVEAES